MINKNTTILRIRSFDLHSTIGKKTTFFKNVCVVEYLQSIVHCFTSLYRCKFVLFFAILNRILWLLIIHKLNVSNSIVIDKSTAEKNRIYKALCKNKIKIELKNECLSFFWLSNWIVLSLFDCAHRTKAIHLARKKTTTEWCDIPKCYWIVCIYIQCYGRSIKKGLKLELYDFLFRVQVNSHTWKHFFVVVIFRLKNPLCFRDFVVLDIIRVDYRYIYWLDY